MQGDDSHAGRPGPESATDVAGFVAALRRLKAWSGLSYRQLERRAELAGEVLPRSTLTTALTRGLLPREELVVAFVRACGGDAEEAQRWSAARRRVAAGMGASPQAGDPEQAGDAEQTGPAPMEVASAAARDGWRVSGGLLAVVTVVVLAVLALAFGALRPGAGTGAVDSTPPSVQSRVSAREPAVLPTWRLPTDGQLDRPPPAPVGAPSVLYVGDTIAVETGKAVSFFVHGAGTAGIVTVARQGTALCDYLAGGVPPWRGAPASSVPAGEKLPALVKRVRPAMVALQFWGYSSAATPCTGGVPPGSDDYYRHYAAAAREAVRQIAAAAAEAGIARPRLLWVLQGPDRDNPHRTRRLNEDIYAVVAGTHGDLVSDAGWHVSMAAYPYKEIPDGRYQWHHFLPCTEAERRFGYCTKPEAYGGVTMIRRFDDHLCLGAITGNPPACDTRSPGLLRYGAVIAYTITRNLPAR